MNKIYILFAIFFFSLNPAFAILRDTLIENELVNKTFEKPYSNLNYNYSSIEKVPIKLNITKSISTKNDEIFEGQIINFRVKDNVFYNHKLILRRGTIVTARVETYIEKGMNGLPATIILDNFNVPNIPLEKLKCTVIHKGMNLALIVFPIKWILTPIPFAGSTTNFIVGGHAKIKEKNTITIYYYPHWAE